MVATLQLYARSALAVAVSVTLTALAVPIEKRAGSALKEAY
ncbi:hypothetical protein BIW11_02853 [Tropilaelaps mercedesae]|uniref:Uncharacterized protein n=1 Tax=Tropilaelaps mercedesae TaxID=418985 RepID=A0A1V9XWE7_9ACAR|nr:hypothetical protein BIW11_02853 [Tropilaelaps mercedesae]